MRGASEHITIRLPAALEAAARRAAAAAGMGWSDWLRCAIQGAVEGSAQAPAVPAADPKLNEVLAALSRIERAIGDLAVVEEGGE